MRGEKSRVNSISFCKPLPFFSYYVNNCLCFVIFIENNPAHSETGILREWLLQNVAKLKELTALSYESFRNRRLRNVSTPDHVQCLI